MKKNRVRTASIVLAIFIAFLIGWRVWPHSLSDMISVDKSSIMDYAATARVGGIKDGVPYSVDCQIDSLHANNAEPKELLEILDSCTYRTDFRNLLPWTIDSVGADRNYDDRSATLSLSWGNNKNDYANIYFLSSSQIAVKCGSDSEFAIYHPADHNVLEYLITYIQENGTES